MPKSNLPMTYLYSLCQSGSQQKTDGTFNVRELMKGLFPTPMTGLRETNKGQLSTPGPGTDREPVINNT